MSNIDLKVHCHEEASKARASGRPVWKETIDFSSFWDNDEISIYNKASKAADILKKKYPNKINFGHDEYNYTLGSIFEEFEELSKCNGEGADEEIDTNEFDAILNNLYDWADYNRVWVKTTL